MTTVEINSLAEIIPETREIKDFYAGKGCAECNDTGYQGRMGIREVLDVTNDIRQLVLSKASAQEIKEQAVKDGMTTMLTDGLQKVAAGQTSIEEIIRIIHE
jgi:type II secretory ATPase GspE/PulE/Tfp pilus assembly ATPase PilB-like protein